MKYVLFGLLLCACSKHSDPPAPTPKAVTPTAVANPLPDAAELDPASDEEGEAEGGMNQEVVQLHAPDGTVVELSVRAKPGVDGPGVQQLIAFYDDRETVVYVDDRRESDEQVASVKVLRDGRVELTSTQSIGHLVMELTQRFAWDAKSRKLVPQGKPIEKDRDR